MTAVVLVLLGFLALVGVAYAVGRAFARREPELPTLSPKLPTRRDEP